MENEQTDDTMANPPAPATDQAALLAQSEKAVALSPADAEAKHLAELHANRMHKKGARAVFHLINFGGLHQAFNNGASVVITYVMATTGLAHKMKESMGTSAIGKGLSLVLNAPSKAINGIFKLCGMDMDKALNALPAHEREIEVGLRKATSSRNAIEVAFMTIAGFIALAPVYYLENHRQGFLNKVDNWLHPGRTPKEKEAAALKPGDEPKETLWNLFRARIIALAAVFGIDQVRTNFDSIIKFNHQNAGKPGMYKNVDTIAGWGFGNWLYDKLPEKTRGWLARFFSGSLKGDNVILSKIQDETRGDVLQLIKAPEHVIEKGKEIATLGEKIQKEMRTATPNKTLIEGFRGEIKVIEEGLKAAGHGNVVERAVFAEQSRLFFTKEVFLTTILSIIIYSCTKSATIAHGMEKIGLAKKGTYDKEHHIGKYARKREKPEGQLLKTEERVAKTEAAVETRTTVETKAAQVELQPETLAPVVPIEPRRARPELKPAESHAAAIQEQKTTLQASPVGIGA